MEPTQTKTRRSILTWIIVLLSIIILLLIYIIIRGSIDGWSSYRITPKEDPKKAHVEVKNSAQVFSAGERVVLTGRMTGGSNTYYVTLELNMLQDNIVSGTYRDQEDYFNVNGFRSDNYIELHGNQGSRKHPWTFTLNWNNASRRWEGTAKRDDGKYNWPIWLEKN